VDLIPGVDDGEGLLILADGSLRRVVRCQGLNLDLLDPPVRERLSKDLAALAAALDTDIQIVATSEKLSEDEFPPAYSFYRNTDQYFDWYGEYVKSWFQLVCQASLVPVRNFYVIVSHHPVPGPSIEQEWNGAQIHLPAGSLEALERHTKRVCDDLTDCNLRPAILTSAQLRTLLERHHCQLMGPEKLETEIDQPSLSVEIENEFVSLTYPCWQSVGSCCKRRATAIKYVGVQCLQKLPAQMRAGWLGELLTIGIEHTLSIFLRPTDVEPQDNHIKQSATKYLQVGLYVGIEAESLELLKQQMNAMEDVFSRVGAVVAQDRQRPLESWQSTLPVAVDKLSLRHRVSARSVGTFWPFFTAACGTTDGVILGLAPGSHEPVMFNPFMRSASKYNHNILITGGAASARMHMMMLLILRQLPLGVRFIALHDTFDGYEFISQILGPEFCENIILGNTGYILNPFDVAAYEVYNGIPSGDKLRSLLSFFDLILAPEGKEELNVQEKALLNQLLIKAYAHTSARNTVPTMSEFTNLVAQTAAEEPHTAKGELLHKLASELSIFTRPGAYSSLIDGLTNLDVTNKKLITFDTRNLGGQRYEKAVLFMLTQFIMRAASQAKCSNNYRFGVFVHRANSGFMSSEAGTQMLNNLSKITRDYGMLFVVDTDRLSSLYSKAGSDASLLRNAPTKFVLGLNPRDLASLREELMLTDTQIQAVENFAFDDMNFRCLLIIGHSTGIVRIVPSPMDYWISSTEPFRDTPRRSQKVQELKASNPELTHTDACRLAVYYLGANMQST